jgi:exopolyphosphatase/guanosine-5'-triphosphate,3'-diphosphate pyrophosphatase
MLGCIDLGSNSFHLLIAEPSDGGYKIVERLSEKVQLGENLSANGKITSQSFERGLACLHRFKLLMRQYPLQRYWALGTNTFRTADNANDFIHSAKTVGIDISIISGFQEASLVYAGVLTALPRSQAHRLVFDIGGGSTEVVVGKNHKRLLAESLPIGSVAWRDRFFSRGACSEVELASQMSEGSEEAFSVFSAIASGIVNVGWEEAYASSGTVKMLANICEGYGCEPRQVELATLLRHRKEMVNSICFGQELPGLKERRRDLLLPGWCIMVGLMKAYGIKKIQFSPAALREGMLDMMLKNGKTLQIMRSSDLPEVSYAK